MAKVAYPAMSQLGYSDRLTTGAIAGGGALGILNPPSTIMVIYGVLTETNIGKLFAAGILSGILATFLLCLAVQWIVWTDPASVPRSTVLSSEEEEIIVTFRQHTLLPLDEYLYALQATITHLTRSSLHRCLKRHGISRLPEIAGEKAAKKPFKRYPIGYFHIDIAEVRTEEGGRDRSRALQGSYRADR